MTTAVSKPVRLVFAISLTAWLAASPTTHAQQTNLPPSAAPQAAAKAKKATRSPFAKGTVERLDRSSKKLTIKTPDGSQTYKLDEHSYIFRGKEKLSFDKLKVGDNIKLSSYTNEQGETFVKRIKVDVPEPPAEAAPIPPPSM